MRACGRLPIPFLIEMKERFEHPPAFSSLEDSNNYFSRLDTLFHTCQLEYCNNRFISEMMQRIDDHEKRIRRLTFNYADNENICVTQHIEMINCFIYNNVDRLVILATEHVQQARELAYHALFRKAPPSSYQSLPRMTV